MPLIGIRDTRGPPFWNREGRARKAGGIGSPLSALLHGPTEHNVGDSRGGGDLVMGDRWLVGGAGMIPEL